MHQVANVLELHIQYHSFQWMFMIVTSFRIDWFDLLAVQGIHKGLFHHHNWKASIFWHSAFVMVQLSCLYMTAGKIIGLTISTFASKVISLLFDMLSRFVIAFLSRSRCLLISRLHSPTSVIFGAQGQKYCHCFYFFPFYLPWSNGTRCHDLNFFFFLMLSFSPAFSLFSFTSSRGYLVPLHFLPLEWCHLHF